jgi:hypothetical protein
MTSLMERALGQLALGHVVCASIGLHMVIERELTREITVGTSVDVAQWTKL